MLRLSFIIAAILSFGVSHSVCAEKPDVLFILIDSLKASHIGCYGYGRNTTPNIDRLAKTEFVRFETCIAAGSWTQPAVMSLFTSLTADRHGRVMPKQSHDKDAVTLAQVFRDAGYYTVGITANAMTNRRYGYAKGFDVWDDYSATLPPNVGMDKISVGYARGMVVSRLGLNRLSKRIPGKPMFMFLFYMDPHWEYHPPPPYDTLFVKDDTPQLKQVWKIKGKDVSPSQRERVVSAYDGEIAYCDHAISNLISEVRMSERGDNTIIVIAGDHGESFWERGFSSHGSNLYDEELKVPLFIRPALMDSCFRRGAVVRGQVGSIDIAPTLLDLAGLPIPRLWQGQSLKGFLRGGKSDGRPVVSETRIRDGIWQRSVRTDRYKIISRIPFETPFEVYDLIADPQETVNIVKSFVTLPEEVQKLHEFLIPAK